TAAKAIAPRTEIDTQNFVSYWSE
ncbi:MAG TPA: nitroreductase, partial [Acinetobacter radioresistens]|nr:nitroreductase [Acinetobacter radioresistens]